MRLTSSAFKNGETIPKLYTGEGKDISPPLAWSAAPPGTKSFALVCEDPDAPNGTFYHWAIYDIAPDVTAFAEGATPGGTKEGMNDFDKRGYGGPMPPKGHGPHHYHFRLFALSAERLSLPANAAVPDVTRAAKKHKLAEAELMGIYER